jgi:hypothetical protein
MRLPVQQRRQVEQGAARLPANTHLHPSDTNYLLLQASPGAGDDAALRHHGEVKIATAARSPGIRGCVRLAVGTEQSQLVLEVFQGAADRRGGERVGRQDAADDADHLQMGDGDAAALAGEVVPLGQRAQPEWLCRPASTSPPCGKTRSKGLRRS